MLNRTIVADLHNHSTASDGEYSPKALVEKAQSLNLNAVALTDHDTIEGVNEAAKTGETIGITVIPGVEVSLAFKRSFFVGTLHLLLYFHRQYLNDSIFIEELNEIMGQGRGLPLVDARVNAINEIFGPDGSQPMLTNKLTSEELTSYSSNVTRRHFALALKEKHGLESRENVNRLIGNDSPAYIPSGIDMNLLTPFLKKYPLLIVFAHPAAGSFPGESHYKEVLPPIETVEKLLPEFLNPDILGINGIEVHYPAHTNEHREKLLEWSKQYNLIITGGSDCHDFEQRPLGVEGLVSNEWDNFYSKFIELD